MVSLFGRGVDRRRGTEEERVPCCGALLRALAEQKPEFP